jgi:hypothetical protein
MACIAEALGAMNRVHVPFEDETDAGERRLRVSREWKR